jgi:flavin-dependent dehydrogenase
MATVTTRSDVVIVGGGPAGGTAAYELARRGLNVVLLEKERLPRYKVCAGGLTLKTAQLLDFDLTPVYESEITRGKCTFRCRSPVNIDFGGQRVREIENKATEAIVKTSGRGFRCSVVIGADGANSLVARASGLMPRRRAAVALETEIPASPDVLEARRGCVHFDFGLVPRGYGWVFPKKEILSIGVGSFWGKATGLKASLFNLMEMLGLTGDPRQVRVRGHLLPLGGEDRVLHEGRVLLAGDAAGLAEPLTGEGIYYAVRSAKIAADVIHRTLQDDAIDLSPYSIQVNAEISHDLRYARALAGLLYRLPRLCYHFFVKSPAVQWGVADVIYGRSSFEHLYRTLLKTSPRILLAGLR